MQPWERVITFPFHIKDMVKRVPGVRWDLEAKQWLCPIEALPELAPFAVRVVPFNRASSLTLPAVDVSGLRSHQAFAAKTAVRELADGSGCWFIFDEPGLGKAATAVRVIAAMNMSTLVVCPASVIKTWEVETKKWWINTPGKEHPITWVSSDSLHKIENASFYTLVVVDEAHWFKNPNSARSKALAALLPGKKVLGLSGTPTPNNIQDISGMAHLLWPNRLGRWGKGAKYSFQFNHYFLEGTNDGTDIEPRWIWGGLKQERAADLERRINAICTRNTWSSVEPGCIFIPGTRYVEMSQRQIGDYHKACAAPISNNERFSEVAKVLAKLKVNVACEWIKEHEGQKVVVYTHLKDTAEQIAEEFGVVCITGEVQASLRSFAIKELERLGKPVIATMHSIGLGINELADFDACLFAELYWKHDVIEQAASRLRRLSKPKSSTLDFLVCVDTIDEHMADVLTSKLKCIQSVGLNPSVGGLLLESVGKSDAEVLNDLFNDETRRLDEC